MDGDPSKVVPMQTVLEKAKLTSGSLYYHFEDFQDLIDHALVERYTAFTRMGMSGLSSIFDASHSVADVRSALTPLIETRHSEEQRKTRVAVAWIAAQAAVRPDLQKKLLPAQLELTNTISDLIRQGQDRGFVRTELDPEVIAVFLQAYALGRIVDDLAGNIMDSKAWVRFIEAMVSASILADG